MTQADRILLAEKTVAATVRRLPADLRPLARAVPVLYEKTPKDGVLAEGFPQMVKVNREVVVLDSAYQIPPNAPILCRISMLKEQALIPDLEAIEQRIAAEIVANR